MQLYAAVRVLDIQDQQMQDWKLTDLTRRFLKTFVISQLSAVELKHFDVGRTANKHML